MGMNVSERLLLGGCLGGSSFIDIEGHASDAPAHSTDPYASRAVAAARRNGEGQYRSYWPCHSEVEHGVATTQAPLAV